MELLLEADYSHVKKTSVVRTEIYPLIAKQMPNRWANIKKEIGTYITENHEQLYAAAPYYRIPFGPKNYEAFYKALGIPEKELEKYMKKCFFYNLNFNPRAAKNPFTAAMICIIIYHLKHNDMKNAKLAAIYLSFSGQFYPSIHYHFFQYLPKQSVMDYVINNRLNDKYWLKKTGNVFGAIEHFVETWIDGYKKLLLSNDWDDDDYARTMVQQLHDRIKAFIKNVSKEYYEADENEEYLNYAVDNVEEDNFHLTNANSVKADRYTENAVNYMVTKDVNYKFCGMVADQNVKKDEIKNIMSSIFHNKDNIVDLKKVVNIIIVDFMNEYPEEPITGVKFLNYCMSTKPNTKDPDLLFIRETIVRWLNTNSIDYVRRKSRTATATSYYKAVLKMIVLTISAANK